MPQREPALRWLRDCALTALVLALCTLTSWVFFRLDFVSSNYILTYILGVMYINVFTSGLVYGVVASLFSVMLVNYMFIDPFMQFRIRSDDMVTAVVMLCVSLLCSSLTGRIKVQAAQSERKAYASQVLLEASRSLLGAEDPDTILRITATQLGKLLERPVCFAPAPEHIAPGTLILPPPAQTDYRSCPALHEFSTYEHNLALSILDVCSLALEKEASNRARREIEEAARQEQLRANLLRSISHDLRTPLTSISGYAELIENGMAKQEDIPTFGHRIHKEAQRMITLVSDILQLSELDGMSKQQENSPTADFVPVDLGVLVKDVATNMTVNARKAYITLQYKVQPVTVRGSHDLLTELVTNLCDNAIRYNRPGGHVELSCGTNADGCPYFCVEDNGIGIPQDSQSRVFERFYRVDKSRSKATGGTGLGLAIVKHIAVLHGARIDLESTVGTGTTIRIIFPKM
mgnify:CR=1 FL=1